MSPEDIPLPSPPPDSNLRGHMSALFARRFTDNPAVDVSSDPADSEGDASGRKRVGFRPWTTNILEAQLSTPDSEVPPSLRSLPPSRDCLLTVRPILKPSLSAQSIVSLDGQIEKISSLQTMDSLLQNLSVDERSSSVDAYQTMISLIKTYDEPPEQEVLQRKMVQLQKHIKRDLVALDVNIDTLPSEERLSMGNLVMSALKVLVTIVWSSVYSPCLTDDFRTWTVERAIHVLKDRVAPKAILLHYIHLLATQNFRSLIMTQANRVQRILEALQELSDHITGKAVVAERLLVYQKLIQQAKQIMRLNPGLWIKNIFTALGHSFKEIRSNAISAGTEAYAAYAGAISVSTAARNALAETTNDRTLSVSITNRLERVLAAKDEANQIPQIWTLVLLLCNAGQQKLDTWAEFTDWLKLIQRCFNSSDMTVKVQAFLAWNRLYYIARPHEACERVVSMLAKPAIAQLDRTGNNQISKGTRQAVISSYCMLLYYAFRPSASSQQYTRMWNEFVVKLMTTSFLSKSSANCDLSCRILAALFYSTVSKTRVWNENRAHESAALDPLELPAIDCKWTRSKTPSILSIFQLLVEYSSFGPSDLISAQAYAPQAWRHLMKAIKESMCKEVTPSSDTRIAIVSIIDFLRPSANVSTASGSDKKERLALLAEIAVSELDPLLILQTLETSSIPLNSILLNSLVAQISEASEEKLTQNTTRDQVLDRCLQLLATEVEVVMSIDSDMSSAHRFLILALTESTLKYLGAKRTFKSSSALRTLVLRIFEDIDKRFLPGTGSIKHTEVHYEFCKSIMDLTKPMGPADQDVVDSMVLAALHSTHKKVRELGQQHTTTSKETLDEHAESLSEVHDSSAMNTDLANTTEASAKTAETIHKPRRTTGRQSSSNVSTPVQTRSRRSRGKPRHEDSQIEFVSVASSPPAPTFESQLLTAHQKEVRARQTAEPAVTFADIKSSPTSGNKGSFLPKGQLESSTMKDVPSTPTLPVSRIHEDDEQPPTPTPRTRKSRRLNVQPEVTSSPPSASGDARSSSGINITSSPVKDVVESEHDISFEDVEKAIITSQLKDLKPAIISADNQSRAGDHLNEQPLAEHLSSREVGKAVDSASVSEQYETAEIDRSSPIAYSDEYDALAASQLSQGLVEESSFMTSRLEDEEPTPSPKHTRKRKGSQQDSTPAKKQRKVVTKSVVNNKVVARSTGQSGDIDPTVHVHAEKFVQPSPRVTRARAAQESQELSQTSQASSTADTPKGRKAKKSARNKRGRPKKLENSQSSRDPSPEQPISVSAAEQDEDIEDKSSTGDTEMIESYETLNSSLRSVVEETAQSENRAAVAPDVPLEDSNVQSTTEIPLVKRDGEAPHEPELQVPIPGADLVKSTSTNIATMATTDTTTNLDIVGNLRNVLESLTDETSVHAQNLDLASIHSLCFRIGLKAQELASRSSRESF